MAKRRTEKEDKALDNLWNKLMKELNILDDNNLKARVLYDYITRKFKPKET